MANRGRPVDEHGGGGGTVSEEREGMEGGLVSASSETAVWAFAFYVGL